MRRISVALPAAVALVCATYTIVYLVRWEWNRAIIAGLFFVAAEVVVATVVLVERLRRIEGRLESLGGAAPEPGPPDVALDAIRGAAPAPRDHFAWVRDQAGRTNVFLPVLLGAGVLASALAWAVEHLARATLTPARERRLAASLGPLQPPAALFGPVSVPATAPPHRLRRVVVDLAVAGVVVGGAVGAVAAVDFVADRTQTRPDAYVAGVDTVVELQLRGAIAAHDPERILGHLWGTCTGPDVFRTRTLPAPEVVHGPGGEVRLLVDAHIGPHALARLRGCLNDTTLDRVQARVVRAASTPG